MNLFLSAIKAEFALALTVFIMEEDFTIGPDWRYWANAGDVETTLSGRQEAGDMLSQVDISISPLQTCLICWRHCGQFSNIFELNKQQRIEVCSMPFIRAQTHCQVV